MPDDLNAVQHDMPPEIEKVLLPVLTALEMQYMRDWYRRASYVQKLWEGQIICRLAALTHPHPPAKPSRDEQAMEVLRKNPALLEDLMYNFAKREWVVVVRAEARTASFSDPADALLSLPPQPVSLPATPENSPATEGKQVMPKVDGKPFRCDCMCNVFTEYAPLRFRCNACGATYTGEQDNSSATDGVFRIKKKGGWRGRRSRRRRYRWRGW